MKRILVFALASVLISGFSPASSQTAAPAKAAPPAAAEKATPPGHEMMTKMQENLKDMQQMLGQKQLTPEQQKKMQEMVTKMQGMMAQMHEKMMAKPGEEMEMCPMMKKMKVKEEATNKRIKDLEERVDKLEKAKGKSK
jgi:predicted RecB family endonuclease